MLAGRSDDEAVITIQEAAQRLGCSLSMAYKLFRRGELKGYRVGSKIVVYARSVPEYREQNANRRAAAAPPASRPSAARPKVTPDMIPARLHLRLD